ncbi:MAG: exosortase system-associated protein, TIGR04073 family, partial [Candidatus Omnitrophota bacterium]|nr:exosortase system-associated protein, TIGR04073 family [Candidatus Omnitrophota bacterium]
MLRKICALVMVLALAFSVTAYAAEATAPEVKDQNAGTKLARGSVNLLAGWLEFPKQIYMVSKEENPYIGLTYGFVKGLYEGIARTGMGIFETVTCV